MKSLSGSSGWRPRRRPRTLRTACGAWLLVLLGQAVRAAADEPFVDGQGIALVPLPPGELLMGSPPDEAGRREDETQHRVRLTRGFTIGQYEVTRGQFAQFVADTGYQTEGERGSGGYGVDPATGELLGPDARFDWRSVGFGQTDEHPVVNVTWHDAQAFCEWLSQREGAAYRLPTEAEWEYAARAGATSSFPWGDDPERLVEFGNVVDAAAHAVYPERIHLAADDGHVYTAPVGSFAPNAWGLYDMQGNVWEWTADWFAPHSPAEQTDPRGAAEPQVAGRTIKGGDWYHDWSFARPAQRFPIPPNLTRRHGGFRVVRELPTMQP